MWADRWLCPDSAESHWIKIKVWSYHSLQPALEMFLVYNLMFTNLANDSAEQTVFNKPDWKISTKSVKSGCFSPTVFKCNLIFYMEIHRVGQMLLFLTWLPLCRAHINTFYWCFPDVQTLREIKKKKRAPVCVLLCLCSSSLRVNLFPQNIQLQTKGRSPECQRRCARRCDVFPYTFPQPAMWQMCCFFFPMLDPLIKHAPTVRAPPQTTSENFKRKQSIMLPYLPPDSLQLGQVHATLRSLLPSWPSWSSSSTSLTRRWDRSLVFKVESVLSCQSPVSGSSLIWMSGNECVR